MSNNSHAAYQKLVERFTQLHRFNHLNSLAMWDQSVMMPSGGNQARSEAIAELSGLCHNLLTAEEVGEWIQEASQNPANDVIQASLREMGTRYRHASVMPETLVKAKSLATSACEHAWRSQRPENDWQGFKTNLAEVLKLTREEATIRAESSGTDCYDALLELYEPGMTCQQLDGLFNDVKSWLPGFIQTALDHQKSESCQKPSGPYDTEQLKALSVAVMKTLAFDFDHGRLDVSAHPFCGGVPEDVRITTRYKNDDFIESLMGVIHETGHASYEQNLPRETVALPVGQARSMGIHESQSLFFEMQVGRSPEFLAMIRPLLLEHLTAGDEPAEFALDNLQKIYTRVKPGFIRVEADEITYPAHVILRYEIERGLLEGNLDLDDVPDAWNEKMQAYLGLSTEGNYKDGCMQDIHWPMGAIGYFPSYTLGAMYAAQQFAAMNKAIPTIRDQIHNGDLSNMRQWLKANIWDHGCHYSTSELIEKATGEPLNANYFKQHLQQRYLS